jgi:hypothetical protein
MIACMKAPHARAMVVICSRLARAP